MKTLYVCGCCGKTFEHGWHWDMSDEDQKMEETGNMILCAETCENSHAMPADNRAVSQSIDWDSSNFPEGEINYANVEYEPEKKEPKSVWLYFRERVNRDEDSPLPNYRIVRQKYIRASSGYDVLSD